MQEQHFHVFLSHNNKDRDFVRKLSKRLYHAGVVAWLDSLAIRSGYAWEKEIRQAIDQCEGFAVFLGANGWSRNHKREVLWALEKQKGNPSYKIIPVLLPGVRKEFFADPEVGEIFTQIHWVDFSKGLDDDEPFHRLLTGIRGELPFPEGPTEITPYDINLDASRWIEKGRKDKSILYREARLREAHKIAEEYPDELDTYANEFLEASIHEEKQSILLSRIISICLGGISLFAIVAALLAVIYGGQVGLAWILERQANQKLQVGQTARAQEALTAQAGNTQQANVAQAANTREAEQAAIAQGEATQRAKAEAQTEAQTKISRAGELAKQAAELRDTNPVLSFLLSVEAFRSVDNFQTRSTLFENALAFPHLKQFISLGGDGLAFSPDGKTLAKGAGNSIVLFDTATWNRTRTFTYPTELFRVQSLAFSPDGRILASGSAFGIVLWNVASGKILYTLETQTKWDDNLSIVSVIFDPNGKFFVTGRKNGEVILWSVTADQPLPIFTRSDEYPLNSMALSPNGQILALDDEISEIDLLDTNTGEAIGQQLKGAGVSSLVFSSDGKILISGDLKNNITFWDVTTSQVIRTLVGDGDRIHSLAISPDGKTLAYGSYTAKGRFDSRIFIWDMVAGKLRDTFVVGENFLTPVENLEFSPDGKTLASRYGGLLVIWDMIENQPMVKTLVGHESAVKNVDFNLYNNTLVSISDDGTAITWDISTGQVLSTQSGQQAQQNFGVGVHGDIFVRSEGNRVELFDTKTDKLIGKPLVGHTAYIETIVFSPDGKTLATGSDDKTVILWDVNSGEMIVRLTGHTGRVFSLAFSPDGKKLASGSEDGTVRIWNIEPWSWMEEVCQRAGRNLQMPKDTSNFGPVEWENYVPNDEWTRYFPGEDYHISCPQWPAGN